MAVDESAFRRLFAALLEGESWDDAFSVVSEFSLGDQLPTLISAGAWRLLASGRLATVERWIEWGERHGVDAPELTLARAEVYLRHGDWQLAETSRYLQRGSAGRLNFAHAPTSALDMRRTCSMTFHGRRCISTMHLPSIVRLRQLGEDFGDDSSRRSLLMHRSDKQHMKQWRTQATQLPPISSACARRAF